jgi:hypothetical protein
MKDKLIKWLGGVTKQQQEDTRALYERWAVDNLTGKNGEVTPDYLIYSPFYGDDIVIIRSRITILGCVIKGLKVAPWCKEVSASGLIVEGVK